MQSRPWSRCSAEAGDNVKAASVQHYGLMTPEWLTAIAALLSAVVWPAVFLIALVLFFSPLRALLQREDVSLTGPAGISITAKRQADAVDALLRAERDQGRTPSRGSIRREVRDAAQRLGVLPRAPLVLWVDDRPSNNRHEKAALEALGLVVEISTTTDEALEKLRSQRANFGIVITDMGRPGDARAGYTLLDSMRVEGDQTPVVIYASSREASHYDEAIRHGAIGCTDRPQELIDIVVRGLRVRDT